MQGLRQPETPPVLRRKFPVAKQRRLDELLDKNREGVITAAERTRLERLVAEAEELMVANARQLQILVGLIG